MGLLAPLVAGTSVTAQSPPESSTIHQDISERDELIAAQETLLNAYRCRFEVDAYAVLGGCADGRPLLGPSEPGNFAGNPTQQDIAIRDELVAAQESLLNVYRCRFNIDTQVVPDRCISPPTSPEQNQISASPFTTIASGSLHSCGIRDDDTVACWGFNNHGQADAPGDRFRAISVGLWHSCGIKIDGTAHCWGSNLIVNLHDALSYYAGQADPPEGQFTAISAGVFHSCGLRIDQTITCWGSNYAGQADPPEGQFTAISVGNDHGCAINIDQTITCWGWNSHGQADPPGGIFIAVSAGNTHSCGIRGLGTVECWGDNRLVGCPSGHVHVEGTYQCLGDDIRGPADAPQGYFIAVAAGKNHSCGIRTGGSIECWGSNIADQLNAPQSLFSAISAGNQISCGIATDGNVKCWGDSRWVQADPPEEIFTDFTVGSGHRCTIRPDECRDWTSILPVGVLWVT